jgi:type IV pilus assembly protein PilY1
MKLHATLPRKMLVTLVAMTACVLSAPLWADDSEIYYSLGGSGTGPNVIFVIDNSGSMSQTVANSTSTGNPIPYNSGTTYANSGCDPSTYYLVANGSSGSGGNGNGNGNGGGGSGSSGSVTSVCSNTSGAIQTTSLQCTQGLAAMASVGYYTDNFARWTVAKKSSGWSATFHSGTSYATQDVACKGDYNPSSPVSSPGNGHGYPAATLLEWYNGLINLPALQALVWWSSNTGVAYTVYSGNYLNYLAANSPSNNTSSKMTLVHSAMTALLPTLPSNWNVALMTYNYDSRPTSSSGGGGPASGGDNKCYPAGGFSGYGGCVLVPFVPLSNAANITTLVNAVNSLQPSGDTPLVGSLYEAMLYVEGLGEYFGATSSVLSSSVGGAGATYSTPVTAANSACQKNFVVFLTDGMPNESPSYVDTLIKSAPLNLGANACTDAALLPGSACTTGGGGYGGGGGSPVNGGTCLSALTSYMNNRARFPVQSYFLAFGSDPCLVAGFNYLQNAAVKGGGNAYLVQDAGTLTSVLNQIGVQILQIASSFTSPTVAVNAFNRTQTLNDIYESMFLPSPDYHWPGNLKHYTLSTSGSTSGKIVDSTGALAVANGFISPNAISTFAGQATADANGAATTSAGLVDGATVTKGGSADLMPSWQQRQVFTYVGVNPTSPVSLGTTAASNPYQSTSAYQLSTTSTTFSNAATAAVLLGIPATDTITTPATVINYARGADTYNDLGLNTASTTASRLQMGDTLHGQPGYVFYGNPSNPTDTSLANAYLFTTDNDGFLHCINASTGAELWAFIPADMLSTLYDLYVNAPYAGPPKHYTLDGSVQVLKYDANGDGVIEPAQGDRVIVYFGEGRGGSSYYALDVTNPQSPSFMWTIGPTQLPGVGHTWSLPVVARVNTGLATQVSKQKLVLVFGGGYDPSEDGGFNASGDSVGNSIFMVDAVSGALLWQATKTAFPNMLWSIPSSVAVLDTNGDGYADRMYLADIGGQAWRFDITNSSSATSFGVAGGVIGSFGKGPTSGNTVERRFYNTPDLALMEQPGMPLYMSVALGSGNRQHPLLTSNSDRMYVMRDFSPLAALTQAQYNALPVMVDASVTPSSSSAQVALVDITSAVNGGSAPTVAATAPGWQYDFGGTGEKSLSASLTFNSQLLFSTYMPGSANAAAGQCTLPSVGTNTFYALKVQNGGASSVLNGTFHVTLSQTGIAPAPTPLMPPVAATTGGSGSSTSASSGTSGTTRPIYFTAGVEMVINNGLSLLQKTYWTESDAQ